MRSPIPNYPTIYPIFRDRFKSRYGSSRGFDKPNWHADVTAAVNPPAASILRAEVIPPYGGDTQWSNTVAAYAGLSAPLQRLADKLRAVHRFSPPDGTTATEDYERRVSRRPLVTEHPVVRVHPETGEKALYVNPGFTTHIVGVSPHESRRLLGLFYDELARARVHGAVQVGARQHRVLGQPIHRAPRAHRPDDRPRPPAVPGDTGGRRATGTRGRPSVALDGEPFEAIYALAEASAPRGSAGRRLSRGRCESRRVRDPPDARCGKSTECHRLPVRGKP